MNSSPLNKTRAVELLFRPRFDGFSIYTSSDDNTLSSDERIIYIDINLTMMAVCLEVVVHQILG